MQKYERNKVLERVSEERRQERELHLGPDAVSVNSMYFADIAPKGWSILHLVGNGPVRVDERGMVHFTTPIRALALEHGEMPSSFRQRKVIPIELPEGQTSLAKNGNFFTPVLTERDSDLYREFRDEYMPELVADPSWRDRPLPGRKGMRSMTEEQRNAWDSWIRIEAGRDPRTDKLRWPRKNV